MFDRPLGDIREEHLQELVDNLSFEALNFLFDEYLFEALMNYKCRSSAL